MANHGLPLPELSRNMRFSAHIDQGGRLDGMQLMVHRGYAYVGHVHRNKRGHRCLMVRMLRNGN
jgi:hypothetical protein